MLGNNVYHRALEIVHGDMATVDWEAVSRTETQTSIVRSLANGQHKGNAAATHHMR